MSMKIFGLVVLALNFLSAFGADYTPEALNDEVVNLPGAEALSFSFRQFSGYLNISSTKHMHYWFVESQQNPTTDPIAFWTNGGPGCSGLLGFLTEQGPFRPNKDLTLALNPYAWNTIANMVFIEQPCGVGFSYSDDPDTDYKTNDDQAANDNYALIQSFMDRFPQYRANDLYITSESYGGHYMPSLAKVIVDNNAADVTPLLNFKGFAVGNPATTFYSAIPASLDTYWGHQLISKPTWDNFNAACRSGKPNLEECEMYFLKMYREVGDLNPYALDYPVCTEEDGLKKKGRNQRAWLVKNQLIALKEKYQLSEQALRSFSRSVGLEPVAGYEPCEDDYMTSYLNQDKVKTALHVKSDIKWEDCSYTLRYKQTDGMHSMTGYYTYLIDNGFDLNILVYSGDDDDVCATIGTQSWIWDLGYDVSGKEWQSWIVNGQTAGYLTKFKNSKLAFATVHGAGHEVPTYKPAEALVLFKNYLSGAWTDA